MSLGSTASVIIDINHILDGLPSTPSKCCIPRVESHFRSVGSDDIYEPQILSIGPYHHGNPRFQYMQQLKYVYLKRLLERRNESVDRYVNAAAAMEKGARQCYAEPISLDENQFITLLVLDGIFLVELFRYYRSEILRGEDDSVFSDDRQKFQLHRDILLLENQLPLFALHQFFNMTETNGSVVSDENSLIALALHFLCDNISYCRSVPKVWDNKNAADHLLGLIHDSLCLSFAEKMPTESQHNYHYVGKLINSVSGLMEAGIKFEEGQDDNLMNIRFVKGVLTIPQLLIGDEVESQLRNLIVHEQYLPKGKPRYVLDYVIFMYCLLKTSKDVELLCSRGIIVNGLGLDEEICQMFNRLTKGTTVSDQFRYIQVFSSLNIHCGQQRNRWKANLRKNYFNSPWSTISFVAAAVLLIFTMAQTIYTVLAYYNH